MGGSGCQYTATASYLNEHQDSNAGFSQGQCTFCDGGAQGLCFVRWGAIRGVVLSEITLRLFSSHVAPSHFSHCLSLFQKLPSSKLQSCHSNLPSCKLQTRFAVPALRKDVATASDLGS